MGHSVEESWPWPPIDAPEGDSYMGIIDVFHQIHCLDMLRRSIFTEYYGNLREIYKDGLFPFTDHILHCQYVLMQALTCHADLEVVTFNKVKGFKGPFADFGVEKKCRNWDEILEWKERHQITPKGDAFKETPEGIMQIPALGHAVPFPSYKGQEHGNVE
jgi:hypothetical protein